MIEIYGKDGCSFCDKAIQLVHENRIRFSYYKIGTDLTLEEFQEKFPGVKAVPAVTTYGMYIGGYNELVGYVEENCDYEQGNIARDPAQRDYNS